MTQATPLPLHGLSVLELGGGASAAYAGRLLADAGAAVWRTALDDAHRDEGLKRADTASERAYTDVMNAGKRHRPVPGDVATLIAWAQEADLLLLGEASGFEGLAAADQAALKAAPRVASIDLSWFGRQGLRGHWRGNDLVIGALTGMPQMVGRADGPPLAQGDRHATTLAGVTAHIAACAALLGQPAEAPGAARPAARELSVSILEASLVMAEMHLHFFQRDGLPMRRCGLNRFAPNSPVGIYPCRSGWVGITVSTPDQWRALCRALELQAQAADEGLATRERRFERLDEVEAVLCQTLAAHDADHWAAVGRQHKVPIVVVPDAAGVFTHPIFQARQSLATVPTRGGPLQVPRTPFGFTATPIPLPTAAAKPEAAPAPALAQHAQAATRGPAPDGAPLAGLRLVDFSMGWAGPLASRLMADLGAEVLKIEAGRYPDWWRGMNWTPEFIAEQGYEKATIFCGMNRGKQGVSLDLTKPEGRELALTLVARADAVIENQAAGVMAKFGLDYAAMRAAKPDVVMASMSAFGTGNAWSDTRAYGSTLEQGSGLPSLIGWEGDAPTMTHLAHGDPVGGLFGCAATLTALVHRRRTGQGQYVNLSMVESMLQLAMPGLLQHQVAPEVPLRRGNRREAMAPHGFHRCAGDDAWLAIGIDSDAAFAALARAIGRSDWAEDAGLATLSGRQAREDELEAVLNAWCAGRQPEAAAAELQAAGVPAAPLVHADRLAEDAHLASVAFYIDQRRAVSGPQRQCGVSIVQAGRRLGARTAAPLLGEHGADVLGRHAGVSAQDYQALVDSGVVSLAPRPERNLL